MPTAREITDVALEYFHAKHPGWSEQMPMKKEKATRKKVIAMQATDSASLAPKPPRKGSHTRLQMRFDEARQAGESIGHRQGYAKAQQDAQDARKRLSEQERVDVREAIRSLTKMGEANAHAMEALSRACNGLLGNL